ncbi:MAG TPA: metal-sulfur cluster assembly factor [Longimicrobiales bacterium]|nr:metal-sulfur cluster assembly factor [Longimicrobiales bacterium]
MSLPLPSPLPVLPAHVRAAERAPGDDGLRPAPAGRRVFAPFDPARVPAAELPLWLALRDVLDPEIPVSIVDLGLVYDVRSEGGRVVVDLTFTALGCPCMAFIRSDIEERLLREEAVREVDIREVWDPPWSRARMSEGAREMLRRLGVAA